MSQNITDTPRVGGDILGITRFRPKYTVEMEQYICDGISKGINTRASWGTQGYVGDWKNGGKHDPIRPDNLRIRNLVRNWKNGSGITKGEIIEIIGSERDGGGKTSDLLRELDKMDIFTTN
jgi:hypothetical protein